MNQCPSMCITCMTKVDQGLALSVLSDLEVFCKEQEKRGLIDGSCDPYLARTIARMLLSKYRKSDTDDRYALPA